MKKICDDSVGCFRWGGDECLHDIVKMGVKLLKFYCHDIYNIMDVHVVKFEWVRGGFYLYVRVGIYIVGDRDELTIYYCNCFDDFDAKLLEDEW